jgi:hypothetical protein
MDGDARRRGPEESLHLNLRVALVGASGFETRRGSLGPFQGFWFRTPSPLTVSRGPPVIPATIPSSFRGWCPAHRRRKEWRPLRTRRRGCQTPSNVEGDGAAEDDQGLPPPGAEFAFSEAGPSRERQTPKEARAYDFREGIRLGRLENRVACLQAEIRRLKGQLGPLREKLRNRRMRMGEEFGLDAYIAGGFSTDED